MSGPSISLLGSILVVLAGCAPARSEGAVLRWLRCEECNRGELDSVVRFGNQAVGQLENALTGPSASERESVRRQSEDRYAQLQPGAFSLTQYVGHYDSNFVAHYQSQAARALGVIGTPQARAALHEAMRNDSIYRRDVIRTFSRAAPVVLGVVAGNNQGAPRDSLVRVNPTVRVVDSVTGQPLANIRVAFTVDSGGGRLGDSIPPADSVVIRRTNGAGLVSVRWLLGSLADSLNVLRARAFRRSVTFNATGHGLDPRIVFLVQPTNGTRGQPMPGFSVELVDPWDRRAIAFTGAAIANIVGTTAEVSGPVVAGVVTFPSLVPTAVGQGLQIVVRAPGATPALSQPFNVAP